LVTVKALMRSPAENEQVVLVVLVFLVGRLRRQVASVQILAIQERVVGVLDHLKSVVGIAGIAHSDFIVIFIRLRLVVRHSQRMLRGIRLTMHIVGCMNLVGFC
jgi:hypothetical protein